MGIQNNDASAMPSDPVLLAQQISRRIATLQEMLQLIANELDCIPMPATIVARRIVSQSKRRLSQIVKSWNTLRAKHMIKDDIVFLVNQVELVDDDLHILNLRRIHYDNLKRLEKQLEDMEGSLSSYELQTLLRPHIIHEQDSIRSLEQRGELDTHEQGLLNEHRRNLLLYQEILSGIRPYAPVPLITNIMDERKAIDDIDALLTSIRDNSSDDD